MDIDTRWVRLALRDLTGFEGRCDAILFSTDKEFTPPNKDPEMGAFRRRCLGLPKQPEPAGEFDFVVTGGGIAGTCAALSAARLGLKVAFIGLCGDDIFGRFMLDEISKHNVDVSNVVICPNGQTGISIILNNQY